MGNGYDVGKLLQQKLGKNGNLTIRLGEDEVAGGLR